MNEAKQAYDKAAEAFCDHVYGCAECTTTGPHCEIGNSLLRAENEAWDKYREQARYDYRPQVYVSLGGVED